MQVPRGSNLEILAQLPAFFDELIKENNELKERLKRLELQKTTENYDDSVVKNAITQLQKSLSEIKPYDDTEIKKAVESIKPYNDTELKKQIADAVRLCKRADSQYRELFEQIEMIKKG